MVGTGANRQPLTKIHPVMLGQQKGAGEGSLLAQHRQQQQANQERRHQPPQRIGPGPTGPGSQMPPGYGNFGGPPMNQMQYPPPNMYQQSGYNVNAGYGPPGQPNYNQRPPPPQFQAIEQFGSNRPPPPPDDGQKRKRKRMSRWGDKEDKAIVSGPLTLPADLTEEQRKHYLLQFKIEEITVKLRTGELGIPADPADRSPSPEPIYNSEGKRLNTREFRVRKNLEEERHNLIKQAIDGIPNYKPPVDYKPPAQKISDKVYIPAERNPAVNFIGLLIGPRGNTLKRLEKETGCKIIIRGKGSVKEGKVGRIPGQLMPGEDEPLHALITGPTEKEVKKGVQVVTDIVKEGIECPDAANELRRNQLRELAELNGTLIDEEIIKCKNCGATDHRHWECQEQKNITSQIVCHKCGGYGHVAADCRQTMDVSATPQQTFAEKAKMDTEYMSLMAELGVEGPAPPKKSFSEKPSDQAKDRNYGDRNERESKWGPPSSSNHPKSLMDVNTRPQNNNQNFNQYRGSPSSQQNSPPPWMNSQRGPHPGMQGPRGTNFAPPWQQGGPPRGPPSYAAPPPPPPAATYPQQNQVGSWQQATGYPGWPQAQPQYGYNPYQMANQAYGAPPPPWSQQQPPPPPPPPPPS